MKSSCSLSPASGERARVRERLRQDTTARPRSSTGGAGRFWYSRASMRPAPLPDATLARKVGYLAAAWLGPALESVGFSRSRWTLRRVVGEDSGEAIQTIALKIHGSVGW